MMRVGGGAEISGGESVPRSRLSPSPGLGGSPTDSAEHEKRTLQRQLRKVEKEVHEYEHYKEVFFGESLFRDRIVSLGVL